MRYRTFLAFKGHDVLETTSRMEIASFYGVAINEKGKISIDGVVQGVGYIMAEWTPEDAIKDFVRTQLHKKFRIYEATRL